MRKIDIQITKARIKRVGLEFREHNLDVTAEIALLTDDEKEVTTYSIGSASYSCNKIDVPLPIIGFAKEIANQLEEIVTAAAQAELKMIPEATSGQEA